MPTDILTIAGIPFDDFSTPDEMPAGGDQAMVVHKLPGGARVINTLGPDESDINWRGQFFGDAAYANALALDAIRAQGRVVPLVWGGSTRQVIINKFSYRVRRMPNWVFYHISCTVYQNPALGNLQVGPGVSIDELIIIDLGGGTAP